MLGPATLSDVLGYASIGSWLGAQFPQVIENIRRQSADGLALPFLLNWALGDATNLIGCILTHQLPFQTYLAAYFCFVDFTLLLQFFYYRLRYPAKSASFPSGRSRAASTATRHLSSEREVTHYRALSSVAANVAAAAALAAEQEEQARWHRHSLERGSYSAIESREMLDADDTVDEEGLARLTESFHSEGGRGRGKKVSWSQERRAESLGRSRQSTTSPPSRMHASLTMTVPPGAAEELDALVRGRSQSRDASGNADWLASNRRSSRASRKGAGMVFLGVWALFGIGSLAGGQRGLVPSMEWSVGRVLTSADMTVPSLAGIESAGYSDNQSPQLNEGMVIPLLVRAELPEDFGASDQPERSTEFIIGRVSAWVCTTLYLTSRLPQIWKNFIRKSVEGLSVYLFIFAFLGNLFYVASILTSPKLGLPEAEATAFIKESIPYLLGSGGTLMFDITIVTQTFLYRPKAHGRGRRASRSITEEEEGLLSAGVTGALDSGTPSRRRTGMSADPDSTNG